LEEKVGVCREGWLVHLLPILGLTAGRRKSAICFCVPSRIAFKEETD